MSRFIMLLAVAIAIFATGDGVLYFAHHVAAHITLVGDGGNEWG